MSYDWFIQADVSNDNEMRPCKMFPNTRCYDTVKIQYDDHRGSIKWWNFMLLIMQSLATKSVQFVTKNKKSRIWPTHLCG